MHSNTNYDPLMIVYRQFRNPSMVPHIGVMQRGLELCKNELWERIVKTSFDPAISIAGVLSLSLYSISFDLAKYCTTADDSNFGKSMSLVNSPTVWFKIVLSLCLTSCCLDTFSKWFA